MNSEYAAGYTAGYAQRLTGRQPASPVDTPSWMEGYRRGLSINPNIYNYEEE